MYDSNSLPKVSTEKPQWIYYLNKYLNRNLLANHTRKHTVPNKNLLDNNQPIMIVHIIKMHPIVMSIIV